MDGESLTLRCQFETSEERLDVTWLKDGKEIKANKDITVSWTDSVASLTIRELLYPDDSGCYTCKAKNRHGTVESSAQLTVTGKVTLTIVVASLVPAFVA